MVFTIAIGDMARNKLKPNTGSREYGLKQKFAYK